MSLFSELTAHLEEITDLMEFRLENPFKVSAFRNAAQTLSKAGPEAEHLIAEKKIGTMKGIGKGIEAVIYEFYEKHDSETMRELRKDIPESLFELFKIHGLGAKKINILFFSHQVKSLTDLKNLCLQNKVASIKGFGEKTEQKILSEIKRIEESSKFIHLDFGCILHDRITAILQQAKTIKEIRLTGELLRIREVISKIEYVVFAESTDSLLAELKSFFAPDSISAAGSSVFIDAFDVPVELHLVNTHTLLEQMSFELSCDKKYLEKIGYQAPAEFTDDIAMYNALGIPFTPVEQREAGYYFDKSPTGKTSDLTFPEAGLLHFHTTWSDGSNTLGEMVSEGMKLGFDYFAVCDHSKTAAYAGGLREERVLLQDKEIKQLRKTLNVTLFHGVESDIVTDGSLDYPDDFLDHFDFIVASVHSQFNLSEEDMTRRIIKAVEHPRTNVLGHPTGRLLLSRDGYNVSMQKVIDACAANKTAIEINAHPHRLDLDWRWIPYALEKGCLFSINADAHSAEAIALTRYGIMIAKKGGLRKEQVINYFSIDEFSRFIKK